MHSLKGTQVVVTGGSQGLGLAVVEALVEREALVTVLARDEARLREVQARLPVSVVQGDATDKALAARVLRDVRPGIVVLNAGVRPTAAPIHQQTWESFSEAWNTDVRAALHWIQESVALPLPQGSRVLLGSSGAAMGGSPLAGGLTGAKRAMWSMAKYANFSSEQLGLGITFQAIVPMQIFAETGHGRIAAEAYAKRRGVPVEAFIRGNFGNAMTPRLRTARRFDPHRLEVRRRDRVRDQARSRDRLARRVRGSDAPKKIVAAFVYVRSTTREWFDGG